MVEGWSFCSEALCSVNLTNLLILQDNATRYPVLSRITLDYLPIQGSSVPCEHIFSDAGLTDTKCHAQLLPENFSAIQTVKGKYKKERREWRELKEAKHAMERQRWAQDSFEQVQKLKESHSSAKI